MMKVNKLNKTNNLKKPLIIAGGILVAGLVAAAVYITAFNGSIFGWPARDPDDSAVDYNKPTEEQKQAGDEIKKNNVGDTPETKPNTGNDQPPAPAPSPSGKNTVQITNTASNQSETSLQLRYLISSVVNSGTCTLTLKGSGKTVVKTASVQAAASTSTCRGFDIPLSELPAGAWEATLTFENDTLKGSTTSAVTIK